MSAVQKSLDEIKNEIPPFILDLIFMQRARNTRGRPLSVDDAILNAVIRRRVMVDCNMVGGEEVIIDLSGVPGERPDNYTTIYQIPKSLTNGRKIVTPLNISFLDPTRLGTVISATACQNTGVTQLGNAVMDAHGPIPQISSANIQLLNENVVMVRDVILMPANAYLRCVVAHDDEMSDIHTRSYYNFAELVKFAVKAYIYNEYIVDLAQGHLYAGQQLPVVQQIIEGYADANQLYKEYLKNVWQKVSVMNSREAMQRYLKNLTGGSR